MPVEEIVDRYDRLKSARANWETHWLDLAEYILPRKSEPYLLTVKGQKKTKNLYDTTAIEANEMFSASLHGMMVNYQGNWFRLRSENDDLNRKPEVRRWFEDVTKIMHDAIHHPDANFTAQLDEALLDIGPFGTSILTVNEKGFKTGELIFNSWNVQHVVLAEDEYDVVDTAIREFEYSARQMKAMFPDGNFSRKITEAMEKTPDERFCILHVIMPRREYDRNKQDAKNKPWGSWYIEKTEKHLIKEDGYRFFPVNAARWRKENNEIYGQGPGMIALPDIKTLNAMQKSLMIATEKVLEPPMDIPYGYSELSTSPGAFNYRTSSADKSLRPEPIVTVDGRALPITAEGIEARQNAVRRIFFNDQLQLAGGPDMTAFEVAQRMNEKLRYMMPMLGRLQSELFNPLLHKVFGILRAAGKLPEMPEDIRTYKIQYLTRVTQAQQQSDTEAMIGTLQAAAPMMQIDPAVRHVFNLPKGARRIALNLGVPEEFMRSEKETAALTQQEAQMAAAEQRKQDVERAAAAGKDVAASQPQQAA